VILQKQIISKLQKSLQMATRNATVVRVRFVKVLLTGSGAAGKTSFSNLLMKKAINKLHHSTNMVQAKHAISVQKAIVVGSQQTHSEMKSVVWLEMDSESETTYLREVLLSSNKTLSVQENSDKIQNNVRDNTLHGADSLKKSKMAKQDKLSSESKSFVVQTQSIGKRIADILLPLPKVKTKTLRTFDNLVNSAFVASSSHPVANAEKPLYKPGKVLTIITLLDTGGQPEYIHLLPTINIHPMVTFVVHDLSKSLEDQVLVEYSEHGKHVFEPYHLRYSNFDMIKFLMSTINDALEKPVCQVPQLVTIPGKNTSSYLCCVGTHEDKVTLDTIHCTDNELTAMVEKLDCTASVWTNKNGGVLFPVDNTTAGDDFKEDSAAEHIRNKIDALASDRDVFELPITWMLLELEIRQMCLKNNKAYTSFQSCVSIASQSNLITDVEQVKSALLYHHLLGVLLYYPEVPGLCDYVIVDHQWLFDRLSNVVRFTFKSSSNLQASNKLKYSGILCKELIEELQWKEELKEEYFISLLVEMKIIAPIQREDGSGEDYFIPYVLPTYTSQSQGDDILSQYGYLQGEPLLIQFVSNLLPRGFFCCLVVQLLQHLPNGWSHLFSQKDTYRSYSNLIIFRLPDAYSLSLLDKLSYLEVQIRHHEKDFYRKATVHLRVHEILVAGLEIACEQLSYNHGRLQYGFHCQCGEVEEKHIALLARLTPPFHYAQCRYGSITATELKDTHIVWLTEVSNNIVIL